MVNKMNLEIIEQSDLLSQDSLSELSVLAKELEDTVHSAQMNRTRTEMEVSVLNDLKFPTSASKYWQAVREQKVMFQGVVSFSFEYRKTKIKREMLKERIILEKNDLKKQLLEVKLDEYSYRLKDIEHSAHSRIREIKHWSEIKKREAGLSSKEDLLSVDNHQLKSYTRRWINQYLETSNSASTSEMQNLVGQLASGLKLCAKNRILEDVLGCYSEKLVEHLAKKFLQRV